MARGHVVPDAQRDFRLVSPHPLAATLPGVYREAWIDDRARDPGAEPFGPRFLAAFDDLLAPILSTIDNLDAYLDPGTTPEDFLGWLGEWVAATVDETWAEGGRRAFVSAAAELYRRRGTAAGLKAHIEIHTGATVEVIENGASAWSATPGGKIPGTVRPLVVVRVAVDDPAKVDKRKLEALVQAAKPAHVPHRVEVVKATPDATDATGKAAKGPSAGTKPPPAKVPSPKPPDEDGSV
jgi:phage tail-like protein